MWGWMSAIFTLISISHLNMIIGNLKFQNTITELFADVRLICSVRRFGFPAVGRMDLCCFSYCINDLCLSLSLNFFFYLYLCEFMLRCLSSLCPFSIFKQKLNEQFVDTTVHYFCHAFLASKIKWHFIEIQAYFYRLPDLMRYILCTQRIVCHGVCYL